MHKSERVPSKSNIKLIYNPVSINLLSIKKIIKITILSLFIKNLKALPLGKGLGWAFFWIHLTVQFST